MAAVYIHIPFCRKACRYCDFFFTVSLKYADQYLECLMEEISVKEVPFMQEPVGSVYLGGGTPSVLNADQLNNIFDAIHERFSVEKDAEITMEANPDDLSGAYLYSLKDTGVNRLSIGVQSFDARHLELMNRSHNVKQAVTSILNAAEAGFSNINTDLIYGLPGMDARQWEQNLNRTVGLPVVHVSAYHLTFEPGTVFDHWRKRGRIAEVSDAESERQYRMLREVLQDNGYEHYEISNFAKEGYRSRHNSAYWSGERYIGYGPSAHSFDGEERSWNVSSLKKYMEGIVSGTPIFEKETRDRVTRYHDYILTGLRTSEGIRQDIPESHFGKDISHHFQETAQKLIESGDLVFQSGQTRIPPERWLLADRIIRELML